MTQVAVIDADWARFAAAFAGAPPDAIAELIPAETAIAPAATTQKPAAPAPDAASRLRTLPARRQRAALGDHLATLVALALGHDGAEQVDRRQGFFAQGLDSLATLELRNRIQATLGWQLEQRLLFRHNSVDSLADFLAEKYLVAEAAE
jgi:acyl carrier protein